MGILIAFNYECLILTLSLYSLLTYFLTSSFCLWTLWESSIVGFNKTTKYKLSGANRFSLVVLFGLCCDCWMRSIRLLFFMWPFHRKYMQKVCERRHRNKLVVSSRPHHHRKLLYVSAAVLAPLTWHAYTIPARQFCMCSGRLHTPLFLTTCFDLDGKVCVCACVSVHGGVVILFGPTCARMWD